MIWGSGTLGNPGVRARLLLAFFGISAFAVLAAGAGIYAFRLVGQRIVLVDARVPPTLTSSNCRARPNALSRRPRGPRCSRPPNGQGATNELGNSMPKLTG